MSLPGKLHLSEAKKTRRKISFKFNCHYWQRSSLLEKVSNPPPPTTTNTLKIATLPLSLQPHLWFPDPQIVRYQVHYLVGVNGYVYDDVQ